tara:strand:+ start:543 stop:1130 length:588 start_codon:yes stop_codon:yes gene_type:complete
MISHNDPKFLFIHLPKNAGSSVTKVLANYIGVEREELRPQKCKFIYARDIPNVLNNKQDDYFIFSVVRNPWERVVSYFHYLQQIRQPPHNLDKNVKFSNWVRAGGHRGLQTQMSQLADEFPCNVSNHINYVARLERLGEDWSKICEQMGIECDMMWDKKSKHKHYSDYYNQLTKDVVYKFYKNDVDCLGYEFTKE